MAAAIARRNLLLAVALVQIVKSFVTEGITAVAFKGPVLALDLYGDVALRPCLDLDLLVPPADVERSERLLTSAGYSPGPLGGRSRRWRQRQGQRAFYRPDGAQVDLHWRLLLRRHRTVVRRYEALDWDRMLYGARAAGSEPMILVGLWLARDLLEAKLPAAAVGRIDQDAVVGSLGQRHDILATVAIQHQGERTPHRQGAVRPAVDLSARPLGSSRRRPARSGPFRPRSRYADRAMSRYFPCPSE